ncbi:hypothetical protein [Ectorhizobium quercum]|uniref:hypothetical protein n=1 Tax=Ectorhizobium quercum TaxID=2965071 RepID=UPI0035202D7C
MKSGLLAAVLAASPILTALAADIDSVPIETIFATSSGFWEETAADSDAPRRGYYKVVALRQPDRTAKVYLQQIAVTEEGLELVNSTELEALSAMKPYVTDIRPENSNGITTQPGLFATVFLKTDPARSESETWTVLIDDLGEIRVERATN